ncbi:MAG: type II toxin-antitoxin system prevent-host-death family antitoxin [Rhodococcus sp. (in: high G+C Gram-positive bacteria)]|nr:type II toxin-antitoxin system prevent-host-death family antitoxin [Rhodococcus sp. (in: high G+C Gram-positive bacteria)]
MNIPTSNIISITDATRETSRIVTEASDGQSFLVMKNNRPVAGIVSPEMMDRIQTLDEREQDLRLMCLALIRTATDNGARHALDDVAAELGIDLTED